MFVKPFLQGILHIVQSHYCTGDSTVMAPQFHDTSNIITCMRVPFTATA